MTKKIMETTWKDNLKEYQERWNPYYEKLLQKFFTTKQWMEIQENQSINTYDQIFKYIIAFALEKSSISGFKYVIKKESAINLHLNNEIDLIVPSIFKTKKELWFIHVQTREKVAKKTPNGLIKLQVRAQEILNQARNISISAKQFSQNWEVSKYLANQIKEYNDWQLKIFWVTDYKKEQPKIMFAEVVSIEQLIVKKGPLKNPSFSTATKNLKFIIKSDFSNGQNKIIELKEDNKIMVMITPVKIANLLSFLEKIHEKEDHIDSLFISNVRDNKGNTKISKKIFNTLNNSKEPFFEMNNGIVVLCKKIKHKKSSSNWKIILTNIDIINGQQTIRSIWNKRQELKDDAKQKYILLHAYLKGDDKKARLISAASNTQTSISAFEIISTFSFNQNLQDNLLNEGLYYSYRTGTTEYAKQFSSFSKITLKEILKYASIKLDGNVWAKNNLNAIMKEIAFGPSKSKVSELIETASDEEINKKLATIAFIIAQANELKHKLVYAQSFDIFASLFMQNETKARAFLGVYNQQVEKLIKTKEQEDKIPGGNVANLFKAKKHTGDFYKEIRQEFEAFRF